MKSHEKNAGEDFLLSFSDLLLICRKGKYKILFSILFFSLLACIYALTRPVEYFAEATFKEKGKSQSGLNKSLGALFFAGVSENDSEAISLLKSRKLMEYLVNAMDLQGNIGKKESASFFPLKTMKDNFTVEYALFKKKKTPALSDRKKILGITQVIFFNEVPLTLEITFASENEFSVFQERKLIGKGQLSEPFITDNYQFTLIRKHQEPLKSQQYVVTLLPLASTADGIAKKFNIESDRFDKGLIKLSYRHGDRQESAVHLNELMRIYQEYLQHEHLRVANTQLSYLEARQEEMRNQMQTLMTSHAQMLSSDLTNTGFANTQKAIDFLAANQASYKLKLMNLQLEIDRLQKVQEEGEASFDKFSSKEDPAPITTLSGEIRELKQQADSLDLALRYATPLDASELNQAFSAQLNHLGEIKNYKQEIKAILATLQKDDVITPPQAKIMKKPQFMLTPWFEKLLEQSRLTEQPEELINTKASFTSYLNNLEHFFDVQQRSIEQRLAHQQTPQEEFQGINLNIARELYLGYSREINEIQAKILQDQFILKQIDDPEFELTSLSTVLHDPVSTEMITKASALILAIKDTHNRSAKEVERLKAELAIQKGFLTTHLAQTIQLLELHLDHLKGKLQKTQSALLTLIQEQITILQKHMAKYISDRLDSLKLEKKLIEKSVDEIRQDMARLPEKWVTERLIDQQLDLNQKMIEELIKLVESKNINSNLELIQSAPIDSAIIPLHPRSPKLFLYVVLGAFMGAFFSICWLLVQSTVKGIQATTLNLQQAGQHVAGSLEKLQQETPIELIHDKDLDTLRRLAAFLEEPHQHTDSTSGKTLLVIKGKHRDYSPQLAALLARKGHKVLLLPLYSQEDHHQASGLLNALEDKTEEPIIIKNKDYDSILIGGFYRFTNELIASKRFQQLIENLRKQYEWIIIVSDANPASAEAEGLVDYFNYCAMSLGTETLNQLQKYLSNKDRRKITFIFN